MTNGRTVRPAILEVPRRKLLDKLGREITDGRVLDALGRVPRERFVPSACVHLAYEDSALPLSSGQTISQPTIVALMVQALDLRRFDRVLEIGTGSGYQAAILAEMAREVVTIERIPELAESAKALLKDLGYDNIRVELAGPSLGRSEDGPYQAIVVAAAAPKLPRELVHQLASGGRLVVPVGDRTEQTLMKVTRSKDGYLSRSLGACRFVPLIGEGAWPD